jgi:cytochrome P450
MEMAPGMFIVSRHQDAVRILKDTETFSSRPRANPFAMFGPSTVQDQIEDILGNCPESPPLLDNDPPEHSRIRSLVSKVFTTRRVETLEPWIRTLVEQTVAPWADRGRVEVASEFARPLPAAVTADALGAEPDMRDRLNFWADEIMSRTAGPQAPQRNSSWPGTLPR